MCHADLDLARDLRLVIFDLDGTLYPPHPAIDAPYPEVALRLAGRAAGLEGEAARVHFADAMARLAKRIGGRPTNTLTLLSCYDVSFEEFEREIDRVIRIEEALSPDPRAIASVGAVARAFPVALFTTNNDACVNRILARLGMAEFFPPERRLTLSSIGRLPLPREERLAHVKPGRAGFLHLLRRFAVPPEAALMVGDSEVSDILPARALGLRTHQVARPEDLYDLPARLGIGIG